jgi:hypothetical protein
MDGLWEMAFARRIGTPIIGIVPRGNQCVPVAVQKSATDIVGWNTNSIVSAIRQLGRRG